MLKGGKERGETQETAEEELQFSGTKCGKCQLIATVNFGCCSMDEIGRGRKMGKKCGDANFGGAIIKSFHLPKFQHFENRKYNSNFFYKIVNFDYSQQNF